MLPRLASTLLRASPRLLSSQCVHRSQVFTLAQRNMSTTKDTHGLSYALLGTPLHRVPAYVSESGPKAGLVVVQEWWGVNDQVRKTASDIAAATGCQIVVPDLFRSKVCYEAAEAEHELSSLNWPGALRDVGESALWLKSQGCTNVGVLGFCMGGALALGSAVQLPQKMCKPTQCHFAGKDVHTGFSDPPTADELESLLESSGCIYEFYRYPDQGHGFMNGTDWGRQMNTKLNRPPISDAVIGTAMLRVTTFLKKHLLETAPAPRGL